MPGFTAAGLGSAGRRTPGVPPRAGSGPKPAIFGPGSWMFTAPVPGLYAFRLWAGGGAGSGDLNNRYPGGSAGAYAKKTVRLAQGQSVPITVGQGGQQSYNSNLTSRTPGATSATLPSGSVVAGAGFNCSYTNAPTAGGIATGGDINLNGGSGGAPNGGAAATAGQGAFAGSPGQSSTLSGGGGSAPGDELCSGGAGGNAGANNSSIGGAGSVPGGGGGSANGSSSAVGGNGGDGLAIVTYEGA